MRLLIAGSTMPSIQTFKRLILLGDEVGFMDRPSVMFGDHGSIGRDSDIRQLKRDGLAVAVTAHEPKSGPAEHLYAPYVDADLANPRFRRFVFDSMRQDDFASRFIQPTAKHGKALTLGTELRRDLLGDPELPTQDDIGEASVAPMFMGDVGSVEHRRALFKNVLIESSVLVTSTLDVSERTGLFPVSDEPAVCGLIAMRLSDARYVGGTPVASVPLGLAVMTALISDEVLAQLELAQLFEYREQSKDAYEAWTTEINRLAVRITTIDPNEIAKELPTIIHGEFRPRMLEYRNAAKATSERLFGDLIKAAAPYQFPALSIAYLAQLTIPESLALFAAAFAPALGPAVDYFTGRRNLNRSNAAAYLVGITERSEGL